MTGPDRPTRWALVLAGTGASVGFVLAVLLGLRGMGGAAGLAVVLVFAAAGCAAGSLYAILTAVVDQFRGRPVAGRRIAVAAVLFVAGAALPAMVVRLGG